MYTDLKRDSGYGLHFSDPCASVFICGLSGEWQMSHGFRNAGVGVFGSVGAGKINGKQEGEEHNRRPGPERHEERVIAHVVKIIVGSQVRDPTMDQESCKRRTNCSR